MVFLQLTAIDFRYGDITYRNGDKNEFKGNASLGLGGAAAVEGPLNSESSYIFSYRRSYLDVIAGALNAGGLPSYDDIQGKITISPILQHSQFSCYRW